MCIQFGETKIQLLILLIYPVGILSARISGYYYYTSPYFYLFIFFLSHYISLVILLLYRMKEKVFSQKKSLEENNLEQKETQEEEKIQIEKLKTNQLYIIKTETKKKNRRQKILRMLFIGILYFISYVFFYYSNFITNTSFYGNISMITEILYFSLFDKLIFGNKIYYHHLFAMIIITISILGLYIVLIIQFIQNNEWQFWRDIFFPTLLNFIVYLVFCYHLIQAKYYIEKFFIFPYEFNVFLGFNRFNIIIYF